MTSTRKEDAVEKGVAIPIGAVFSRPSPKELVLAGAWTACGLGKIERRLGAINLEGEAAVMLDATRIEALDTAGAWVLQKLLARLRGEGAPVSIQGLNPAFRGLMDEVALSVGSLDVHAARPAITHRLVVERIGHSTLAAYSEALALLAFVGELASSLWRCVLQPTRLRWRPILFNIRTAGVDALPIIGLLSLLLGVVVAYQGAGQLRRYGANIFIVDLIGVSMLREFAPLITAIIVAGRSGSAYAAQIGTMAVTEELDAMRTLGIDPLEMLVIPKLIALAVVLPLLTVFADALGVLGGLILAGQQLGVGAGEFLDRFAKVVLASTALTGIGKAPVFAVIIAIIGCYRGFSTKGAADAVGRQTTRSVVQSIFLVIVADAVFSVVFSALDL